MLLVSKISLGTNNLCIQKYENKPSNLQSMSQRFDNYLENSRNTNGGYDFFPISFTRFLKTEYSQIISRFERQIELLQAKGDKNPLTSNLSIFSAAEKTMDSKLQDIEKNIDPNLVQRILKWKKSRESKLQQLVKEANACKGKLNSCDFNLKQAISETIKNLSEISNLVSKLETYKTEYTGLISSLEADPGRFGIDQRTFDSTRPLLNAHDLEVSNMISTLNKVMSLNQENLILAGLKDGNLAETDQRIKELNASGVNNLSTLGISPASYYNESSSVSGLTVAKLSQKIRGLRSKTDGVMSKLKKPVAIILLSASAVGGLGYGIHESGQPSKLEMKMGMEKPAVLAAIRQANRIDGHVRDEMKFQTYFENFSNMSRDEVDYLIMNMYSRKNADIMLNHYLNYIKNKPTAEYEQKLKSQMEKKYPDFMNSLYLAERITDLKQRNETLVELFDNNYTQFSIDEIRFLASKAYLLNWSDRVFRMYSLYKDSHR